MTGVRVFLGLTAGVALSLAGLYRYFTYEASPAKPNLSAPEMPERFAGLAAVAANLPTPENCACAQPRVPSAMLLMNGTSDPVNPYNGGDVSFFGLQSRGTVLSSHETARFFAQVNGITEPPSRVQLPHVEASGETSVTLSHYSQPGRHPVVEVTVVNGGHVLPNPDFRPRRFLGKSTRDVDGPAILLGAYL